MKLLIIIFFILEFIAVAMYIQSCWPERTKRSLPIKILCSTIFVVYAVVLAVLIRRGANMSFVNATKELSSAANTFIQFPNGTATSRVVHLIIAALAYGWVGDFFLGLAHQIGDGQKNTAAEKNVDYKAQLANKKTAANALGVLSFILGHALYCVAFGRALAGYELSLHWWTFLLFLLPILAYAAIGIKLKLGKHLAPLGVYFIAVSAMFGLSLTLGISLWSISKAFSLCLIIGGTLFTLSDLLLSLESYGGERFQRFGLRVVRQIAYFAGQMLLATTILFFYAV